MIDLSALQAYIKSHVSVVLLVLVLVEGLMAAATALTAERYKAFALVQLGRVADEAAGVQGAMLERFKAELDAFPAGKGRSDHATATQEDRFRLPVTFELRQPGRVFLMAEGDSAEAARDNVARATRRLLQLSTEVFEQTMKLRGENVKFLQEAIAELDGDIRNMANDARAGQGLAPYPMQWSKAAGLARLAELRVELQSKLISRKLDMLQGATRPAVLSEPAAADAPFKPRWGRNLAYGALFGVPFGLFVVALAGVFRQLGLVRAAVGQVDTSLVP